MKATIQFEIHPPQGCTEDQLREWIKYCIGESPQIKLTNPLSEYEIGDSGIKHLNIDIEN